MLESADQQYWGREAEVGVRHVELLVEEVDARRVRHVQPAEEPGALGVGGRGERVHLEAAELGCSIPNT